MTYSIKEAFYSLQGEGAQAGRPTVFCRFAGCNLWSGLERDRASAQCDFCDTDFVGVDGLGGGKFVDAIKLASHLSSFWPIEAKGMASNQLRPYVVFTGGEPLLQLDESLINAMHNSGFEVGVETNGTIAAPKGIDWLCVSPKGCADLVQQQGDELKLVYPQPDAMPQQFAKLDFKRFYLQPMESDHTESNTQAALDYCLAHPQWHLSLQTHKLLGIR